MLPIMAEGDFVKMLNYTFNLEIKSVIKYDRTARVFVCLFFPLWLSLEVFSRKKKTGNLRPSRVWPWLTHTHVHTHTLKNANQLAPH